MNEKYFEDYKNDEHRAPLVFDDTDYQKITDYFKSILGQLGDEFDIDYDAFRVTVFDQKDEKYRADDLQINSYRNELRLSRDFIKQVQSIDQFVQYVYLRETGRDYKSIAIEMAKNGFNPINKFNDAFPNYISSKNKSRFDVALTAATRELAEKDKIHVAKIKSTKFDANIKKIVEKATAYSQEHFIDTEFKKLNFDSVNLEQKIKALGIVAGVINAHKDYQYRNWHDKNVVKYKERFNAVMQEIFEQAPRVIVKESDYVNREKDVPEEIVKQINDYGWGRGKLTKYDFRISDDIYPFKVVPDSEYDAAIAENSGRIFGKYEYMLLNELVPHDKGNNIEDFISAVTSHIPKVDLLNAGQIGDDFIKLMKKDFDGELSGPDYNRFKRIRGYFNSYGDRDLINNNICGPDHVPGIRFDGLPQVDISVGAKLPFANPGRTRKLFGMFERDTDDNCAVELSNGDYTFCHFDAKNNKSTWILIDEYKKVKKQFKDFEEYKLFRDEEIKKATDEFYKKIANNIKREIKKIKSLANGDSLYKIPIDELMDLKRITGQTYYWPKFNDDGYINYSEINTETGWSFVRNAFNSDSLSLFDKKGKKDPKINIKELFGNKRRKLSNTDPLVEYVTYDDDTMNKYLSPADIDYLYTIDEKEDNRVFRAIIDRADEIPKKYINLFWTDDDSPVYDIQSRHDDYRSHTQKMLDSVLCGIGFTMKQWGRLIQEISENDEIDSKFKLTIDDVQQYIETQKINIHRRAGGCFKFYRPVNDYFHNEYIDMLKELVENKGEDFKLVNIHKLPHIAHIYNAEKDDKEFFCSPAVRDVSDEISKEYIKHAARNKNNWPSSVRTATDFVKYLRDDKKVVEIFTKTAFRDRNFENVRYAAENISKRFFGRDNNKYADIFCKLSALWTGDIHQKFAMYKTLSERQLFSKDHVIQYKKFRELLPEIIQLSADNRFDMLCNMTRDNLRVHDPVLRGRIHESLTDAMIDIVGGKDDTTDEYKSRIKELTDRLVIANKMDKYEIMKMFAEKCQSQRELSKMLRPSGSVHDDIFSSEGTIYEWLSNVIENNDLGPDFMNFLMGPGDVEDCAILAKIMKDKDSWVEVSENELSLLHKEFTMSHLEAQAFIVNEIMNSMTTRGGGRENWEQVFDQVIGRMFPGTKHSTEDKTIIEFIHAYIKHSPEESRRIKLTAMLCGFRSDGDTQTNKWKGVRQFMENAGPAAIKLGQSMSAFPQVPEELRAELRLLKTDADRPARWDIYEWDEALQSPGAFYDTDTFRDIKGSASYFVAVEKFNNSADNPKTEVVKILRPGAAIKAEDEFVVFENALADLNKNGIHKGKLGIFESVVKHARKSSDIETNLDIGAQQNKIAENLYPKQINIGADKFNLNIMSWNRHGTGYAIMPRADGINFDEIKCPEFKRQIARACFTLEISHILKGGLFDSDRHSGQMKIDKDGKSIGLFDFGSMIMDAPTNDEMVLLGQSLKKSFVGGKLSLEKFSGQIVKNGNPKCLLNALRAIVALSDFSEVLSDTEIMECVMDASKKGAHKEMLKQFESVGWALKFPRITKILMKFGR